MNKKVTVMDIVCDIRQLNQGVPLDGESSHCLVEDMLLLADSLEEAYMAEKIKNVQSL